MALVVRTEDERGFTLERLGIVTALDRQWTASEAERYPWITSIDPYGNTTLNYMQAGHLRRELAELVEEIVVPEDREGIRLLIDWIDGLPDQHRYLKFIGE
jgi:hypothetical protein